MTCPIRCGTESENNDLGRTPYGDGLVQAFHLLPRTAHLLYHMVIAISMLIMENPLREAEIWIAIAAGM